MYKYISFVLLWCVWVYSEWTLYSYVRHTLLCMARVRTSVCVNCFSNQHQPGSRTIDLPIAVTLHQPLTPTLHLLWSLLPLLLPPAAAVHDEEKLQQGFRIVSHFSHNLQWRMEESAILLQFFFACHSHREVAFCGKHKLDKVLLALHTHTHTVIALTSI